MPRYVNEVDRGNYRILPTKENLFIVQEKQIFLNIFVVWTTIEWQTLFGESPVTFDSVEKAKEFIDTRIERRNNTVTHDEGAIYYP